MALHTEKLREVERSRQEDAQLMQDRASQHISRMEVEVTAVKAEEERLRSDLRYIAIGWIIYHHHEKCYVRI